MKAAAQLRRVAALAAPFVALLLWSRTAAVVLAAAGAAVVLLRWRAMRDAVREHVSAAPPLAWSDARVPLQAGQAADYDRSLRELGYRPAGSLSASEQGRPRTALYVHPELPVFVRMEAEERPAPGAVSLLQFDSFFEGGGRLSTCSSRIRARVLALGGAAEGPRLAQLRVDGAPVALDGQHLGTVRAWMAGKRRPLPAQAELLPRYLEEDHRRLLERLRLIGWLPFPVYLRWQVREPPGVLTF